jgi:hypothetical protein
MPHAKTQSYNKSQLISLLAANDQVLIGIQNSLAKYQQASIYFARAYKLMRQAKVKNLASAAPSFDVVDWMINLLWQRKRDRKMEAAMNASALAVAAMLAAIQSITPLMEARDPALIQSIRTVPVAQLYGNSRVQTVAWDAALGQLGADLQCFKFSKKLRENLRALRICGEIVDDHISKLHWFRRQIEEENRCLQQQFISTTR